jgi:hypothetical protein
MPQQNVTRISVPARRVPYKHGQYALRCHRKLTLFHDSRREIKK